MPSWPELPPVHNGCLKTSEGGDAILSLYVLNLILGYVHLLALKAPLSQDGQGIYRNSTLDKHEVLLSIERGQT